MTEQDATSSFMLREFPPSFGFALYKIAERRKILIIAEIERIKRLSAKELGAEFAQRMCVLCGGRGTKQDKEGRDVRFCSCINKKLPFGFRIEV